MVTPKILLVSSIARSLTNFRGDFIESLIQNGFQVLCLAPDFKPEVREELENMGAASLDYSLKRVGLNPLSDFLSIMELKRIMVENNVDLVFPYTIKPVIYSSLAATWANVPVVSLITGLGFTFSNASIKASILQRFIEPLYKFALRQNRLVIFQNTDDQELFIRKRILKKGQPTEIIDGSGVNLDKYPFRNRKAELNGKMIFVIVARLIAEKGIQLFIDAAISLKKEHPAAEFHVIGKPDTTPSAISIDQLLELDRNGLIVYHGSQKRVSDFLAKSDVFVLPSYYREGIPRSILEALSIGMPIITTNAPGCRETVIQGENGLLVPMKDLPALEAAMKHFLQNPSLIERMGARSGALAKERFDVNLINAKLNELIINVLGKGEN